jgi:hypothetical protein
MAMNPRTRRAVRAAAVVVVATLAAPIVADAEPPGTQHLKGVFDDGQRWQISVPPNWNGIFVSDLDSWGEVYDSAGNLRATQGSRADFFLNHAYAYSGTQRHPDRGINWDPRAESINMEKVLDIFQAQIGDPRIRIQFGCSGGGSVSLSMAEDHPSRMDSLSVRHGFDGAVALHASDPTTLANQRLDLVFALKALQDPKGNLPVIPSASEANAAGAAWSAALAQWRQTPLGRARMALALTLAQYPSWGSGAKPALNDRLAIEDAMMDAVGIGVQRAITGRPQWDLPAGIMSWNNDVDYQKFYGNADSLQRSIVKDLYAKAGLHGGNAEKEDLNRINAYPRIEGTLSAVNYWRSRARPGTPLIPLLQISTIGDAETPAANITQYADAVHAYDRDALYRNAYINGTGHCGFNVPEMAAAIATIVKRIETGNWGNSTTPSALNATASTFGLGEARYIEPGPLALWSPPTTFNRAFYPGNSFPGDVREDPDHH